MRIRVKGNGEPHNTGITTENGTLLYITSLDMTLTPQSVLEAKVGFLVLSEDDTPSIDAIAHVSREEVEDQLKEVRRQKKLVEDVEAEIVRFLATSD